MKIIDFLKNSFKDLRSNKKRTFLTVSGVVIGISAVIVIMSVGSGAQSLILDQIVSSGSNIVNVLPGFSDSNGPPASAMGVSIESLKRDDARQIEEKIKEVEVASSFVRGVASVKYQDKNSNFSFIGTDEKYQTVDDFQMLWGNFLTKEDSSSFSKNAVLGYGVYETFFEEGQDPVGKRVKIKNQNFKIIGVMEKRGVEFFQNQDDVVILPIRTAQKIILGIDHVSGIKVLAKSSQDVPMIKNQIDGVLREAHNIEEGADPDFSIRAFVDALEIAESVTSALRIFLAGMAGISLLVGGIGIMNIMLITVSERTREVGLRKALGATNADVQSQFLAEAIVVTFIGGVIGIIVGILVSFLISIVANQLGYNWVFEVSFFSILLGLTVSGLTGVLFGWFPARSAALLEPIEALRYE
jgi:putative ABC transport system permease protein